jgi:hypothetical protein
MPSDSNSIFTFLTVLFTAVLAFLTYRYVRLTARMVSETRELRLLQTKPKILVYLQSGEDFIGKILLIIENVGLGTAYDVSFICDPNVVFLSVRIGDIGFIKNGLKMMPPSYTRKTILTYLTGDFEKTINMEIPVRVSYRGEDSQQYEEDFTLRFSEFRNLRASGPAPLHKIAKELEEIRKSVQHIESGYSQLKVVTQTADEYRTELEDIDEESENPNKPQEDK